MTTSDSLVGKNAIITGASRGTGAQIALKLAARGANNELVTKLHAASVGATSIQEDLAASGAGKRIIDKALAGLNASEIHILVNNAALEPPAVTPVQEVSPELFDRFMQVNARAPLELVQALIPRLPTSGGRIISISSVLARKPEVPLAAWASSKAALECLSRYWAMELGIAHGLTSNVVAVGPALTDYHVNDPPAVLEQLAQFPTAAKRLGTPDDVAQIVAFLASDGGRWINGDVIQGNGGVAFG